MGYRETIHRAEPQAGSREMTQKQMHTTTRRHELHLPADVTPRRRHQPFRPGAILRTPGTQTSRRRP